MKLRKTIHVSSTLLDIFDYVINVGERKPYITAMSVMLYFTASQRRDIVVAWAKVT
jgi:hypothetical protein